MSATIRNAGASLLPVAAVWAALIAFGVWRDADWPDRVFHVWGTLAVMATFLLLVATLMLRRMHGFDWLTVSLAAAFSAVSLMPFYLLAGALWPQYFREHRSDLLYVISVAILIPLIVAILMLLYAGENGYAAQQRAEGVIEGHAAGVAEEKREQHAREEAM